MIYDHQSVFVAWLPLLLLLLQLRGLYSFLQLGIKGQLVVWLKEGKAVALSSCYRVLGSISATKHELSVLLLLLLLLLLMLLLLLLLCFT